MLIGRHTQQKRTLDLMQGKINPLIAAAVGVVVIALAVFFFVRSGKPAGGAGTAGAPNSSAAYTHPGPGNHP